MPITENGIDTEDNLFAQQKIASIKSWVWLYLLALAILISAGALLANGPLFFEMYPQISAGIPCEEVVSGWALQEPFRSILEPWLRWDTVWFLKIAKYSYHPASPELAFPPVYPLLIRGLAWLLGGQYLLAALLISWIALFGSCYLLGTYFAEKYGVQNAQKSIRYLLFFPTAFFFFAGYSESLFLLIVLAAWILADRKQWGWAGVLGALAVLTRYVDIFLVLPLGYMWLKHAIRTRQVRGILPLLLIPASYFAWLSYLSARYGSSPADVLGTEWALHFDWPWTGIIVTFQNIGAVPVLNKVPLFYNLLAVGLVLFSLVWWLRRKHLEEAAFIAGILLISLVKLPNARVLVSTSRYVLPLFPLYFTRLSIQEHKLLDMLLFAASMLLWLLGAIMVFLGYWLA